MVEQTTENRRVGGSIPPLGTIEVKMKHYYFAYGSNTNLRQMEECCPNAVCIGRAFIDGYVFRWRDYADIELDENEYVIGILWEIDDTDLQALDIYEEFPELYTRQKVRINFEDRKLIGWTYIMVKQDFEIEPDKDYKNLVYDGYNHNNLSEEQLDNGLKRFIGE